MDPLHIVNWSYQDARGITRRGTLDAVAEAQGTDVTYFFRRTTGEQDVVSGERLKSARRIFHVIEN